jgi:hypothetical protein
MGKQCEWYLGKMSPNTYLPPLLHADQRRGAPEVPQELRRGVRVGANRGLHFTQRMLIGNR